MSASAPRPPPDGDVNIAWQLEVGALVTFVAAAAAVTLRTWARAKYARLGWDDWLMLFALVRTSLLSPPPPIPFQRFPAAQRLPPSDAAPCRFKP